MLRPKKAYRILLSPLTDIPIGKVCTLPISNGSEQVKQTNEIKYAPILLDQLPIADKDITAYALHTQTELAG